MTHDELAPFVVTASGDGFGVAEIAAMTGLDVVAVIAILDAGAADAARRP